MHHNQLFKLSAEVQTLSAEQAQVQAAGREKNIFSSPTSLLLRRRQIKTEPEK